MTKVKLRLMAIKYQNATSSLLSLELSVTKNTYGPLIRAVGVGEWIGRFIRLRFLAKELTSCAR
ncbi:hypothetical protein EMIT0P176_30076 [Pseudomonas sp. IT-P176]